MRITPNMISDDIISSLQNTYAQIQTYGEQLSSGKRIVRPSDDPAGTAYAIDIQSSLDKNKQYQSSTQSAQSWLESTSSALQQLANVIQRARTLTVQGANDTNAISDRASMSAEIKQLIQQGIQIANTTFGGSSLFAGTLTTTTPYNALGGYSGNSGAISHLVAPNYSMTVNSNAQSIFNGTGGVFNTLNQLVTHLTTSSNFTPAQNTGTEAMSLTGSYTGTPTDYLVKVSAVSASGTITGADVSTDGGVTFTPLVGAGTPPTFSLGNGITANFTNAAITANVGDQFGFTANGTGNAFPIQNSTNVGNEAVSFTGTYAGTGNPVFAVKPITLDANNNVVAVQISTDGGATYGPTVTASNYSGAALSFPTTTSFDGGNGMTFSWTQSSANPAQVVANGDVLTFTPSTVGLGNDLTALDNILSVVSGQQAQFGAQQNSLQANLSQLQSVGVQIQSTLSLTADADIAELSTHMATAKTLYEAALAVDARSIEPTLISFLH